MSRHYKMNIRIAGHDPKRWEQIQDTLSEAWGFDDWDSLDMSLRGNGSSYTQSCTVDGNLAGGESEEEFARRMTRAVWKENRGKCYVEITATYMEELPYESYEYDPSLDDGGLWASIEQELAQEGAES